MKYCNFFFVFLALIPASVFAGPIWTAQNSGTSLYLTDIEYVTATTAYAVGYNGKILKSIDGGVTWNEQTSGVTQNLYDCHFYDANKGWAVGEGGIILNTVTGGLSWTTQFTYTPVTFYQMDMIGTLGGVAVGKNNSTGYVAAYYTTTGGASWTSMNVPLLASTMFDVVTIDATTVLALGNNFLYRTTDSGLNWDLITLPTSELTNRIEMADNLNGWICGNNGLVLHTTDGGLSWVVQSPPTSNNLKGICALDDQHVYVCGTNGSILSSGDGGLTWVVHDTPNSTELASISVFDYASALSCGDMGNILKMEPLSDLDLQVYSGVQGACPKSYIEVKVEVKNNSSTPITSGNFIVLNGITEVINFSWSGNVDPYTTEQIYLGEVLISDNSILTINYSGDDITDNNSIVQPISLIQPSNYGVNGPFTICPGEVVDLFAWGGNSFYWFNATPDSTAQAQHLYVYSDKKFVVRIEQDTCTIFDTVYVDVEDGGICGTNSFTPNNDGVNDFFFIDGIADTANYVTIFSRWGDELMFFENYDNTTVYWNGNNYDGLELPEGVYYYTLESKKDGALTKGWVYILR
ncbi:MAG: gliding motility-associated C-terminal domain-containing protein [Crocinitomicaceae bacterium]|nr:gliding motility-associated C-terminal domain-containing protein [Crocinitomicaceae bacterium]MBK8927958.1 gliding motility-associated C-terminal domain-containing protein [Crocinitomicaceae bacterium]